MRVTKRKEVVAKGKAALAMRRSVGWTRAEWVNEVEGVLVEAFLLFAEAKLAGRNGRRRDARALAAEFDRLLSRRVMQVHVHPVKREFERTEAFEQAVTEMSGGTNPRAPRARGARVQEALRDPARARRPGPGGVLEAGERGDGGPHRVAAGRRSMSSESRALAGRRADGPVAHGVAMGSLSSSPIAKVIDDRAVHGGKRTTRNPARSGFARPEDSARLGILNDHTAEGRRDGLIGHTDQRLDDDVFQRDEGEGLERLPRVVGDAE